MTELTKKYVEMKKIMRATPLGKALDSGFHLQRRDKDIWLCLGQWELQKVKLIEVSIMEKQQENKQLKKKGEVYLHEEQN